MDRNWNRGGGANLNSNSYSNSTNTTGGEKMFRQPYSTGHHYHYRKKNDFSGQEYYNKIVKPVLAQPVVKKEVIQVILIENELMDNNFSWLKNGGNQIH
jgi:hypothetical protein